jgi:TRAP-type uncharacterized transport system fused permease subunit
MLTIAILFILYAYFGAYMPGFLNHRGYSAERIITHLWFTTEGILGVPLGVCSTFIFLFILFGAFMEQTGISMLFIEGRRKSLFFPVRSWVQFPGVQFPILSVREVLPYL